MPLLVISYILPIFALVSMLLILLQGNIRRQTDVVWFQIFLGLLVIWMTLLWLTDQIDQPLISLRLLRSALVVGSFIPAFFFIFSEQFVNQVNKRLTTLFFVGSSAFAVLSLTPLMIESIKKGSVGIVIPNSTSVYALQTLYTVLVFAFCYVWLRRKTKFSENANIAGQLRLIRTGLILALILGVTGGYILNTQGSNLLLPLATATFAGCIFLAIFRHGLFDIRLIVARSTAYLLSLISLGSLFGVGTFSVSNLLLKSDDLHETSVRWLYTILAVALAFAFPPLKRYFDKITSQLFYRDAYDTQVFLDQFNKILVTTYELNPILKKSALIIEDNLKPGYCAFSINETKNTPRRIIGTAGYPKFSQTDFPLVRNVTPKLKRKLIITDLLEVKYEKLQKTLQENNISVMARLTSSINDEGIGYLILGPKKSGNLYNPQDLKVIEIVTNELVIAIQNALHTEEIENFNLTLQAKVNDATRKLQQTNEKLKQLDETKDDFISMASHQLRTPLTSVKGYLSMVLEGDAGKVNATQTKMLHQAFISSQRMVFLITDLLNVSRLKTGKFVIENTPVDLSKLIQEEVTQLVETAQVKQIEITYKKPETFPLLMLDETKIRQVGMNFMDNAIYYTPVGGHINVELINNPNTVELRVADNGIGVPKSEQHHLFTKFYRATNARKTRPDGTGLGLFMAKKVIAAQGGSIIFESRDGQGSTFGFVFSKAKLKVPESAVTSGGGTSLEPSEIQPKIQTTKSLTPTR